ncbi:MAG TPA: histidine kinase dimerization/phospho-acceptor domain-containing protein, partial [Pirellulales bacterium]
MSHLTRRLPARYDPLLAIFCGAMFVAAVAAGWYVHELHVSTLAHLARHLDSMRASHQLSRSLHDVLQSLNRFLISGDDRELQTIGRAQGQVERWLVDSERRTFSDRERRALLAVRRAAEQLQSDCNVLTTLDPLAAKIAAKKIVETSIEQRLVPVFNGFVEMQEEAVADQVAANQILVDRVAASFFVLALAGALLGWVAGFVWAWRWKQSIVRLQVPIRDATGKLDEVVGPVELPASNDPAELNDVVSGLAAQVALVVDRLRQSQRETLRAEQLAALGQVAAGLAHELRNPLTAMKMLVQSAVEQGDQGRLEGRKLRVLDEEIRRQEKSIQEFLDFARPPKLQRQRFDLADAVRQCLELTAGRADLQHVALVPALGDSPCWVQGDPEQLRRVMLNLLLNALDASPANGRISISLRP